MAVMKGLCRVGLLSSITMLIACGTISAQNTPPSDANKQAEEGKAAEASNTTESLQKATQNPVANLISVPVQNNSDFGIGPYNRTQDVLNISNQMAKAIGLLGVSSEARGQAPECTPRRCQDRGRRVTRRDRTRLYKRCAHNAFLVRPFRHKHHGP